MHRKLRRQGFSRCGQGHGGKQVIYFTWPNNHLYGCFFDCMLHDKVKAVKKVTVISQAPLDMSMNYYIDNYNEL